MKIYILLLTMFVPIFAFAANIGTLVTSLNQILGLVVPIIIGFALVAFLWGVLKYFAKGTDEKQRIESRQFMFWGIVGLTVMVSVWGLVSTLARSTGTNLPSGIVPTLPAKR